MAAHADHGGVEIGATEPFDDYDAHKGAYVGFLSLLKYCMAGIAIVLILMAFFLT